MTRAIVIALGLVLSMATAQAQPKKAPAKKAPPKDKKEAPPPESPKPPPDPPKPDQPNADVGNKTEGLQSGETQARPWADGIPQDRQDTAVRLFGEGNGHLNDGIFTKAVESYKEALKSWDHPAIHYNLALALTKLDKPLEVEIHLTKAIAYGPTPLETPDKFEHAKEYLGLNAKLLAWIDVSCDKIGAKVSIDGAEVFTVEAGKPNRYEGRVTIGKHTVVAEKTGYNAQVDAPYIEPGQKFRIELKLYTSEELTRYTRRWKATWIPYVVLGGAVVFGGGAAAMNASAQSSFDNFDAAIKRCNEESSNACESNAALLDMKSSGDTKRTMGYVFYGIAGAALVTGGILLYLNRETSYEITADQYRKELKAKKPVAVAPMVAPGTAGAMVFGRF
jgi:hypothetical protein